MLLHPFLNIIWQVQQCVKSGPPCGILWYTVVYGGRRGLAAFTVINLRTLAGESYAMESL